MKQFYGIDTAKRASTVYPRICYYVGYGYYTLFSRGEYVAVNTFYKVGE